MYYMTQLKTQPHLWFGSGIFFDTDKMSATSYQWWHFVRRIEGEIVFNSYPYSISTQRHQRKLRELMSDLRINVDVEISVRASLDTFRTVKELVIAHNLQIELDARVENEKRLERNARARVRRQENKSARKRYAKLLKPTIALELVRGAR